MLGSTPSVAAVFFTLRDSYGLQHCRPVCIVCSDIRSESRFCLPHLHWMLPLRRFPSEYRHPVWHGKTRMAWLPGGGKISKIPVFVLTQLGHTDTRTDTACRHILRLCIASRGKNYHTLKFMFPTAVATTGVPYASSSVKNNSPP